MTVLDTSDRPVVSADEARARARADYETHLGQVIEVQFLEGYVGDDSQEWRSDPPFLVKVIETDAESLNHWCDEFLDPYWNVEVIDDRGVVPPEAHSHSFWVYGPSYEVPRA